MVVSNRSNMKERGVVVHMDPVASEAFLQILAEFVKGCCLPEQFQ